MECVLLERSVNSLFRSVTGLLAGAEVTDNSVADVHIVLLERIICSD